MKNKILTGIAGLDKLLNGGIEREVITEFCGPDWRTITLFLHKFLVNVAKQHKVAVIYNQNFGGIDPYLIIRLSKSMGLNWISIDNNINVIRTFKPDDVVNAINDANEQIIFIVDPFLNANHWLKKAQIIGEIYRLMINNHTVIIFNRKINSNILGGHFHNHIIHYIFLIKRVGEYLYIKAIKGFDRSREILIPIDSIVGKCDIQFSLNMWLGDLYG